MIIMEKNKKQNKITGKDNNIRSKGSLSYLAGVEKRIEEIVFEKYTEKIKKLLASIVKDSKKIDIILGEILINKKDEAEGIIGFLKNTPEVKLAKIDIEKIEDDVRTDILSLRDEAYKELSLTSGFRNKLDKMMSNTSDYNDYLDD